MSKSNRDYVRVALEKTVFPPGARFENPKDVSDDSVEKVATLLEQFALRTNMVRVDMPTHKDWCVQLAARLRAIGAVHTEAAPTADENIKWAEGVLAHKRDMGDVYAQDFFREFIRRFTAQRAEFVAAQKERDLAEGNRTAAIEVQFKMGEEMERLKAELHRAQDEVARVTKRFDKVQEQAVLLKDEIDPLRAENARLTKLLAEAQVWEQDGARKSKENYIELVELRRRLEAMAPTPASDAELEELATWCSKEDGHCIGCSIKLPRIAVLLRQSKRHRIEWSRDENGFYAAFTDAQGIVHEQGGCDGKVRAIGWLVRLFPAAFGIEIIEHFDKEKQDGKA